MKPGSKPCIQRTAVTSLIRDCRGGLAPGLLLVLWKCMLVVALHSVLHGTCLVSYVTCTQGAMMTRAARLSVGLRPPLQGAGDGRGGKTRSPQSLAFVREPQRQMHMAHVPCTAYVDRLFGHARWGFDDVQGRSMAL